LRSLADAGDDVVVCGGGDIGRGDVGSSALDDAVSRGPIPDYVPSDSLKYVADRQPDSPVDAWG